MNYIRPCISQVDQRNRTNRRCICLYIYVLNQLASQKEKAYQIPEINARLETLAKEKKITFINLYPLFTEKGTNVLKKELTYDGLHLNDEGYKVWVDAIKKKM